MADPPGWQPDPRLSDVPTNVLANRHDTPVRVTSPALQWAAIQVGALTSPEGRGLLPWEMDVIQDIYQTGVDATRVRIVQTTVLNYPTTLGNQIRVPPGWTFEGTHRPILVHEVGHVWQYQTRGTDYITDSVFHNASGQIATGDRNVAYMNYRLTPKSIMSDFTAEEQATIIGDYYEMTRIRYIETPDWIRVRSPDMAIYEQLISEVRSTIPRSEARIYREELMQPPPGPDLNAPGAPEMLPVMPLLKVRF